MAHSLSAAVEDGTISARAAMRGLSIDDIHRLSRRYTQPLSYHSNARVLVNLRGRKSPQEMSIAFLANWFGASGAMLVRGQAYHINDIRSVTAVPA
jgi:hypothetical protein